MDRCLFFSWEPGYIRHPSNGKDRVHLHFKSGRSTSKKGPLRIYGLIAVSGSIPLFRSMYPRFKMQMDRCKCFSWEPGYIRHPSHGKDRVHLHFKSERSTPKKRTPSYIWANSRICKYPII